MAIPVLIIGKSGSGKSASLRNLPPEKTAVINVLGKPMPFRGALANPARQLHSDEYAVVASAIARTKRPVIVLDDAGYLITNQFMRGHSASGGGNAVFTLYNQIADNFYNLIRDIRMKEGSQRVYLIMHEDRSDSGDVKPKTIGKLTDDKVCVEGMFAICLRCMVKDGRHIFRTQSDGFDVAKTPMGMFDCDEIDNDLAKVDEAICAYYEVEDETSEQAQ